MTTLSTKIKNNLQLLTEMHNISEAELCRKANIPQATLNRLLTGATEDPRASTLNTVAAFFNISLDQLLGNQPIIKPVGNTVVERSTFIPILQWEEAANWESLLATAEPGVWKHWIETEASINKTCFALEVTGESMWPQFIEGTLLIVDPTENPNHRDFVVVFLANEGHAIFRQYIEEGKNKILKPLNHAFSATPLSENDKVVGVVVQSKANYKK